MRRFCITRVFFGADYFNLKFSTTHLEQFTTPLIGCSADHDSLDISSLFTVKTLTNTCQADRSAGANIQTLYKLYWNSNKGGQSLCRSRGPCEKEYKYNIDTRKQVLQGCYMEKHHPDSWHFTPTHGNTQTEQTWSKRLLCNTPVVNNNLSMMWKRKKKKIVHLSKYLF